MKEKLHILYEDETCLCINKQAGISVHSDGKSGEVTLADVLIEHYPELRDIGEPLTLSFKGVESIVPKPGIVHRLDKETSGVMLIAKTQEAYEFFKKQFKDRTIQKVYHCFTYGWLKEDTMHISNEIGRDSGDVRKWTTGRAARGVLRTAVTDITVLTRFGNQEYVGKGNTTEGVYSFVEARPKTGRTHQIRVHLRSINHPIVADSLYAAKREKALGFERLALHARELSVLLPSGEKKTVLAPYPIDFENAIAAMETPLG